MQAQVNKNKRKEEAMNRAPNGRFKSKKSNDVEVDVKVEATIPKPVYWLLACIALAICTLAYANFSHAAEEGVPEVAVVKSEVQAETTIEPTEIISHIMGMSVALDSEGTPVGKISTSSATAKVYTHSMSVGETRILLDGVANCVDNTTFGNIMEMRGCLSEVDFITYDVYKTGFIDRVRNWW